MVYQINLWDSHEQIFIWYTKLIYDIMKPKHEICDICESNFILKEKHKEKIKMMRVYTRSYNNKKRIFLPIGWFCWECGRFLVDPDISNEIKKIEKEREDVYFAKNRL